jgi:hypothetical protein
MIKLDIKDMGTYEGEANALSQNRRRGKVSLLNGEVYEGFLLNDKPEGEGLHRFPDGSVYEGQFSNGEKSGNGKFTLSNGS